ncbi:DUF2264 domain-containing protein [Krasilnikoviella flava]|uniref:DUF2264 domain-containing protein n=1 Tax=Krasilnikoviella flava TaxID=526729 RepID=A0A1T5L7K6_9MICO|nr:DUF2264 domain-containing protein [Krasilnikoviella flava]SKC71695.1 hypothetical protein SAMN04324258_3036 [Krasilnikoviella flava]
MTPAATTPPPTSSTHLAAAGGPASDPRLAPARRWTRDRWLATADALLDAVRPFASPGGSLITLPGPVSGSGLWSDGLEGYARTFLLAAFRLRGEDGRDPHGLLERYADGLRHGTDPAGDERWPRVDERRQAVVEAASVAIALSETRPWLWDRLDDGTRRRTVDWLAGVVGTRGYTNNWLWFQNVIEAFLASVGGPWEQADLDHNAETAEALYVGDGWYSDGRGRGGRRQNFDHYAGWAWHVYPLLHARILGRPLEPVHAERLRAYLDQARHLVGSRGAPMLQGRSVTYRHAVLAPFWAGAIADATPLSPGATRALAAAVAEHFDAAGAVDDRGLLPVGWHGPYDRVRQLYTGGSSPYWASKGFLGLLLGADHPVWTAAPELPEAWREPRSLALRAPGWLVSATPADGIVRLLNHGSDRAIEHALAPRADDPFYRRLGYSGATSPQLAPGDVAAPLDSHTALLDARGVPSHRDTVERVHLDDAVAVSRSRVCWLDVPGPDGSTGGRGDRHGDDAGWAGLRRGPVLTTASVVHGPDEVRLAWWTPVAGAVPGRAPRPGTTAADLDQDAAWPADTGPWTLHVGGWPLAAARDGALHVERSDDRVRVVRDDGTTSHVRALPVRTDADARPDAQADVPLDVPLDRAGAGRRRGADPFGPASAVPWLRTSAPVGPAEVVAALVVLTAEEGAHRRPAPAVHLRRTADGGLGGVEVRWPDGRVDIVPTDAATDAPTGAPTGTAE